MEHLYEWKITPTSDGVFENYSARCSRSCKKVASGCRVAWRHRIANLSHGMTEVVTDVSTKEVGSLMICFEKICFLFLRFCEEWRLFHQLEYWGHKNKLLKKFMSRKIKGVTCGVRKKLTCHETICTKICFIMFIVFFVSWLQLDALCEFEKSAATVLAFWIPPKNPVIHQAPGRLHFSCMPFYIHNMCSVFQDLEISSQEAKGEVASTDVCCCSYTSFLNAAEWNVIAVASELTTLNSLCIMINACLVSMINQFISWPIMSTNICIPCAMCNVMCCENTSSIYLDTMRYKASVTWHTASRGTESASAFTVRIFLGFEQHAALATGLQDHYKLVQSLTARKEKHLSLSSFFLMIYASHVHSATKSW